jgi:GntR family transcriptional regulator of abcA and norABC
MLITDKITAYIKENGLQPGDRLPTYREFAKLFNVSAHTIGNALERLQHKGAVDIRPQSGIFVMEEAWKTLYPKTFNWYAYLQRSKKTPVELLKRYTESRTRYATSEPQYMLSTLGLSEEYGWYPVWEKALKIAMNRLSSDRYTWPSNDDILRISQALSENMKHYGLDLPPESILPFREVSITMLLIVLTFFSPSTKCYYVSPSMMDVSTFFFDMTGIIKIPIPFDNEGINLEYLSERIQKGDKAFLIAEPEIGLSGITMSMKKRRELYSLCYANGIPIVEIDQYREYHSSALPPIKALDKHGIVFYIGEFTSLFCGSVTAGWIAATPELIERLSYVLLSLSFIYEVLPHETMYEMLISGDYRKYVTKLQ